MRDLATLLLLPATLSTIVCESIVRAHETSWPQVQPGTLGLSLEQEAFVQREREALEKLIRQAPIGVKKMSGDEGEKFFLQYWEFGEMATQNGFQQHEELGNASISFPLLPGIVPHSADKGLGIALLGRSLFARDFKCPKNTHSCSNSINANICCHADQTCVSTSDGPGCCPDGETCGGSVGNCPAGQTSCNNGCCIAGAVCKGAGCVIYGTQTVTTTLKTVTKTSGAKSTTVTGNGKTVTVFQPTLRVSTETITLNPSGQTKTKTVTVSSKQHKTTTTKVSPSAPVLPTSVSARTRTTNSNCIPGYYMCSAHFLGGCCKVGRDCDTTHCPPTGTTITAGNGVTVIESEATRTLGVCTSGLYSCPASVQGGCCPNGYRCGLESCSAGKNGLGNIAKIAPNGGTMLHWAGGFMILALTAGIGMILL